MARRAALVRGARIAAAAVIVAVMVSACTPSTPTPEPPPLASDRSPEPEPRPTAEPEPVDHSWQLDSPENRDMDAASLAALHRALEGTPVQSVVTVRGGVIVDEFYNTGYDEFSMFRLRSVTKSVTSALIGIAIEQGGIEGVDVPLSHYFPELMTREDARWQRLTLRHLLDQTSGIDWPELSGAGNIWREFSTSPNWVEFVLGRPLAAMPGERYEYSTGNSHLLMAVLERATGMRGQEFAEAHLLEPLGMRSVSWRSDPQGVTDGGAGITMSARDAARFGQLFLNGGAWNGEQIVPGWWVAESTAVHSHPQGRIAEFGAYGYQWWVRPFGAGHDTFYAQGIFGQFVFVVPGLDLVTVFTSDYPVEGSWVPSSFFTDYVLAAVR